MRIEKKSSKKNTKSFISKLLNNKSKKTTSRTNSKTIINRTKIKSKKLETRKTWKKIVTAILILGIVGVLMITLFLGYVVVTSPKFDEAAFDVKDQTVIYDINNEIIATIGAEKRESVTYDQLPQVLIDAIIATEDSRYFQHNGVDLPRFLKASVYQLIGRSEAGGASTITMQTVKNNLTSTVSHGIKGIIRKFQDVYLSVFKVEKEYSKEEILELYVNNYNLGSNIYGVGEASKYYFGKSVSELTLPEASLIAGLFQAPNRHNPYKNMDSAVARRNTVLTLMVRHGYITEEEASLAKKVTIESMIVGTKDDSVYQGYIDTVVDEVEKLTGDNPYKVPMKIYTTMEKSIQDGLNNIYTNPGYYWKDDSVQGGIAVINVETGAIAAIGAGRNRTGERTFNYATGAYKQPGSTAKPIFDYGPSIEYNNYSSYTLVVDEPWTYTNGPAVNNWDGGFGGLMTISYALQNSRNIPALKTYQQVGSKNCAAFATKLGLDVALNESSDNYKVLSPGVDNTINEAYSIGGVAKGYTPLEMASAYAGFASGGYYTTPYAVTKIEYRDTSEVTEYKPVKERVMKDSTAYIINNILELATIYGFSGGAYTDGSHVATKTGTSNYSESIMKKYHLPDNAVNDLWTIAYTSKYSVAVWYGYEELTETTYNISSGGYKESLVSAVMTTIPKDTTGWTMPSSVVSVAVERGTWPAKLPSQYTPQDLITNEVFVRGTQPTEISERFQQLPDVENLKTKVNNNSVTITWSPYTKPKVLTESYIKEYFNQSIFGNSKAKLAEERIASNKESLGDIIFGIYFKEDDGTITLIDTTKSNTYTYTGYGNVTLIVKAEHTKFLSNASSGISATVNLGGTKGTIIANLNGNETMSTKIGTYVESGFSNIYYNSNSILNDASIDYQLINGTIITDYNNKSDLVSAINLLSFGSYKIKYIISYKGATLVKTRNLTLTK